MTDNRGKGFARRVTLDNLETFLPLLQRKKDSQSKSSSDSSKQAEQEAVADDPSLANALALFEGDPIEVSIPFKRERAAGTTSADQSPVTATQVTAGNAVASSEEPVGQGFVMILQQTDAGVGQITTGKARRSPEIFIPLAARDYLPEFWGWPDLFTEDPKKSGKMDRRNVRMLLGGAIVIVNMMTWPLKHDFRLRSESLRSAGNVGDILKIEAHTGNAEVSYEVEVIAQGDPRYAEYLALAINPVRNSPKRWGYY